MYRGMQPALLGSILVAVLGSGTAHGDRPTAFRIVKVGSVPGRSWKEIPRVVPWLQRLGQPLVLQTGHETSLHMGFKKRRALGKVETAWSEMIEVPLDHFVIDPLFLKTNDTETSLVSATVDGDLNLEPGVHWQMPFGKALVGAVVPQGPSELLDLLYAGHHFDISTSYPLLSPADQALKAHGRLLNHMSSILHAGHDIGLRWGDIMSFVPTYLSEERPTSWHEFQ